MTTKPVKVPDFSFLFKFVNKKGKFDSLFEKLDRNIKTIAGVDIQIPESKGYLQILVFSVRDVYEFLSTVALLLIIGLGFALLSGSTVGFALAIILPLYAVALYYSRLKKYQKRFFVDLADIIETMLQGLSVGLPIEEVLEYVAQTKTTDNIVTPFIKEVVIRLNAGQSLKDALEEVAYKTLSPEFERIARILSLRSETTTDITKSLRTLYENIQVRQENDVLTQVEKFNVTFLLLMVVGYVLPFMMAIMYPLITLVFKGGMFIP